MRLKGLPLILVLLLMGCSYGCESNRPLDDEDVEQEEFYDEEVEGYGEDYEAEELEDAEESLDSSVDQEGLEAPDSNYTGGDANESAPPPSESNEGEDLEEESDGYYRDDSVEEESDEDYDEGEDYSEEEEYVDDGEITEGEEEYDEEDEY